MTPLSEIFLSRPEITATRRLAPPATLMGKQVWQNLVDGRLEASASQPPRPLAIPADLEELRQAVASFAIFSGAQNEWWVISTDHWLSNTVNRKFVPSEDPEEGADPYLSHVYVLAECSGDGVIGVDTHPDRLGWIGFYWGQFNLQECGHPVVAHSFREWVERTLAGGAEQPYWELPGFVDLGPAVPGDPSYVPLCSDAIPHPAPAVPPRTTPIIPSSLVAFAQTLPPVELTFRDAPPDYPIGKQVFKAIAGDGALVIFPNPPRDLVVPPELEDFRTSVRALDMFPPRPDFIGGRPPNNWSSTTDGWLTLSVNQDIEHTDDEAQGAHPYLREAYALVDNPEQGVIGVDTHPDRLGWIGFFEYDQPLTEGGFPVIAHSFREFLERAVQAGPAALYWQQEDFKDLGPFIPGDENYCGPQAFEPPL